MKLRKVLAMFLVLIMSMSLLAACASDEEKGDTSEEVKTESNETTDKEEAEAPEGLQPEDGAELLVWESEGPEGDFMERAIEEFNKIYPDVTINYEPVGHTDAKGKLALDGPAGVGADVFAAPHDHLGELVESGLIIPNTEFNANYAETFVPAAVTAVTYKGETYGYPVSIETYALFYNKDIVDEPVKTWDELKEFAKEYNNPSENKFALMFEAANAYYDYMFLGGYGSKLFGESGEDREQLGFDNENGVEAMKFLHSIRTDIMDIAAADISYDVMMQGFNSGQFPYMINGPWAIQDCKDAGTNFGIVELPVLPNGEHPESFSGVRGLYVSSYTEYPNAAMLFANFCADLEMTKERFEITHQIPVRTDYQVEDEFIAGVMAQAKYAKPMPAIPEMGSYWTVMGSVYTNIWEGAEPEAELEAAKEAMLAMYE
ncbi:sugar ABC transporter substrate-binding protein [Vallitalea okinawensis]|uniref:sugar ABC transporter substrate-binding protein n=1 Tax=Vallitalea okinawensis TaxID=2078660 RepID=UPI000CFBB3F5|nr:maltose ABC transporter substrate-binding protein [Vallitalea okinawensis]